MRHFTGGRRGLVGATLLLLTALGLAILRASASAGGSGVPFGAAWAMVDFESNVYYPVTAFWGGANPYDWDVYLGQYPAPEPFPPYLPGTFLLYLPFGLMPAGVSATIYFVLAVALTVLLAFAAFRYNDLQVRSCAVLALAGMILLSRPGQSNLLLGQLTAQAVLASYAALYYARRSPPVSGLCLAVSMLKPGFGLPLAALMLARRDTRAVALGTAVTVITNLPLIAVLAHRAGGVRPLIGQLIEGYMVFQRIPDVDAAASRIRIDAIALGSRFLGYPLNGPAQLLITLVVLGLAALALRRIGSTERGSKNGLSASIICVAVLLSVYHQAYDLLLLTLPLVALACRSLTSAFDADYVRWPLLGLFTIVAFNYAATDSVLSFLTPKRGVWLMLTSINGAALLAIFLMYISITLFQGVPRGTDGARP